MSDFRDALESWIQNGMDERVCEALKFGFLPPIIEQVIFVQKMREWMILEKMCQFGLRKSVDFYVHNTMVMEEDLLWGVEMCAQHNSPSIFEFLKRPEFCTDKVAKSLYENHPLMWLKCHSHFSADIQKSALQFGLSLSQGGLHINHPLHVLHWESERNNRPVFESFSTGYPVALWAALGNCSWVYEKTPVENLSTCWKELGKEVLEHPHPYKSGHNKILDSVLKQLRTLPVEGLNGPTTALKEVIDQHFRTHGPVGIRSLVQRFGERGCLDLLTHKGKDLIWMLQNNIDVLDGLPIVSDYLHKTNIKSLAAADLCYSILPYTSRTYRSSLNKYLRQCAQETLAERVVIRRKVLTSHRAVGIDDTTKSSL